MTTIQIERLTAPASWASYLINGDASGMDDAEQAQCDAWTASLVEAGFVGWPVDCEDAGFIRHHNATAFCPLAADCLSYSFVPLKGGAR